jgi:hypothetical protein
MRSKHNKTGWIDMGIVENDVQIEERHTRTRDFVTGEVWHRFLGSCRNRGG